MASLPGTYWKPARELAAGDIAVENDGYLWLVITANHVNRNVIVRLTPYMDSVTARGTRDLCFKQSARIRVQEVTRG